MTEDGIAVAALLKRQKALVTSTAVYNSGQALAALGAGSDFIAPYLGRMNNAGRNVSRPVPQNWEMGEGGPKEPPKPADGLHILVSQLGTVNKQCYHS